MNDKKTLKEILDMGRATTAVAIAVPTLVLISLYGLCSIIASERGISFLEVFNDFQIVTLVAIAIIGIIVIVVVLIALYEGIKEGFIEKELK